MQSNEKIPSFHSIHQQFCHLPPQDTHLNSSMNSPSLVRQLLLLNFCVIKSPYKLISHFLLSFQLKDLSGSDLLKNELVTDMSLELGSFLKYGYIIRFNIGRQDSQAIERYFTSNQSSKIILGIFSLCLPFFFSFIWVSELLTSPTNFVLKQFLFLYFTFISLCTMLHPTQNFWVFVPKMPMCFYKLLHRVSYTY